MKGLVTTTLVSLLALAACGGSDGPSFGPETEPTASQQAGITSTEQGLVVLAAADTQGAATAGAAFEFATSSLALITPSSARVASERPFALPIAERVFSVAGALADECVVIGDTSVVWTNCMEQGFTIDGKVSWGPGHVEVDVTVSGAFQGFTFEYQLEGNITVTPSSIQGETTVTGTASGSGMTLSQTVHSEIDVQIADGCITTGTLTVEVSGSGNGAVNGAAQIVWTGCHVARVRNG